MPAAADFGSLWRTIHTPGSTLSTARSTAQLTSNRFRCSTSILGCRSCVTTPHTHRLALRRLTNEYCLLRLVAPHPSHGAATTLSAEKKLARHCCRGTAAGGSCCGWAVTLDCACQSGCGWRAAAAARGTTATSPHPPCSTLCHSSSEQPEISSPCLQPLLHPLPATGQQLQQ